MPVEMPLQKPDRPVRDDGAVLTLRLLGPMAATRGGVALALPPSRKVRALLAYLAMSAHAVPRDALCELLWDQPGDPRAELRWALSRLRRVVDTPGRRCLQVDGEAVRLDRSGLVVDAGAVCAALQADSDPMTADALRALLTLFEGDFLQGLDIDRSSAYSAWVLGQRRRLRAVHAALLEQLATALPSASDECLATVERWLQLSPFDDRAHRLLLAALAQRGRLRDGDEHLAATVARFRGEGLEAAALVQAWRHMRPGRAAGAEAAALPPPPAATRRASIALMPFDDDPGTGPSRPGLARGLTQDLITGLARLRQLRVIAAGSMFALHERGLGSEEAARRLNVDYIASGSLHRRGEGLRIHAQLAQSPGARILWADSFDLALADTLQALDTIGHRIVSAITQQVERAERERALRKPAADLDAWEAHHCGLWHMMRFNRDDNRRAQQHFEAALQRDPGFSRPYTGLSFTQFQNAFQGWDDRARSVDLAYRYASQAALADDADPGARWALGRALWLQGHEPQALAELQTSVALSPNFAFGHYTLAFVQAQSGDAQAAIDASDLARELSPFDPLMFGMLGSRALALMRLGRHDEAAEWALRATARPNAHAHIGGIAACCLLLAGRDDQAQQVLSDVRRGWSGYGVDDFLQAYRFGPDGQALVRRVSARWAPRA